jgi:hypothetical protein
MLILAMDVAMQTGLCSGEPGETPVFETVRFGEPGDTPFETGAQCLIWIARRLKENRPDLIVIEEPIPYASGDAMRGQTNATSITKLHGLYMIIGATARAKGVKVMPLKIISCRTPFIGSGSRKRPDGRIVGGPLKRKEAKRRSMFMCRTLGWDPKNEDEGDAGCLWWNGCVQVAPNLAPKISPMMRRQSASVALRTAA